MNTNAAASNSIKSFRAYEADYFGWLEDQIGLLKAGNLSNIDTQNIAEEIVSVARRQYDCLEDAAHALIYNLLKWDLMPDRRSASAVLSMDAHRDQITHVLARNPSLAAEKSKALGRAYLYATYDVMRDCDLPKSAFASQCPYDWETVRTREITFDLVTSPSGTSPL
jgi:Domain of unknown function DUF29